MRKSDTSVAVLGVVVAAGGFLGARAAVYPGSVIAEKRAPASPNPIRVDPSADENRVLPGTIILAGSDAWITRLGDAEHTFAAPDALPADFFGPGSDPFEGAVSFVGLPLITDPPDALGDADTIVERLGDTTDLELGPSTVDIQIRALSLVSVEPITVTYNGGQDPEEWNVALCLPDTTPQPVGSMTITMTHPDGGTFDSILPVVPRFTFTRVSDATTVELDCGQNPCSPISLVGTSSPWALLVDGPQNLQRADFVGAPDFGPVPVDADCDGDPNGPNDLVTFGVSANFLAGGDAQHVCLCCPAIVEDDCHTVLACPDPPADELHIVYPLPNCVMLNTVGSIHARADLHLSPVECKIVEFTILSGDIAWTNAVALSEDLRTMWQFTNCDQEPVAPFEAVAEFEALGPGKVLVRVTMQANAPEVGVVRELETYSVFYISADQCTEAADVTPPLGGSSQTYGCTSGATDDVAPDCAGITATAPGVWYKVTGTGKRLSASLCNTFTNYNAALSVYTNGCAGLCCIVADDSPGCVTLDWCSELGREYLMLVHGVGEATGHLRLDVLDGPGPAPCPVPTGACCLGDGSCQVLAECECAAAGGTYQGDGTGCDPDPCPPPSPIGGGGPKGPPGDTSPQEGGQDHDIPGSRGR